MLFVLLIHEWGGARQLPMTLEGVLYTFQKLSEVYWISFLQKVFKDEAVGYGWIIILSA